MLLTGISKTSCVSSSIWTLMETCRPGGWAGGRRPGSRVDTPKLSGAPSLCPAVDDLSAGSTMVTDATVRGSRAADTSVHVWRREERTVQYVLKIWSFVLSLFMCFKPAKCSVCDFCYFWLGKHIVCRFMREGSSISSDRQASTYVHTLNSKVTLHPVRWYIYKHNSLVWYSWFILHRNWIKQSFSCGDGGKLGA